MHRMKPDELVQSIAYRGLRRLRQFLYAPGADMKTWPEGPGPRLQPAEKFIGVYENEPGSRAEAVVATTLGLHVCIGDAWRFFAHAEMERVDAAPQEKTALDELLIALRDGSTFQLPVRGGRGRLRDAWPFLHFLRRVAGCPHRDQPCD